MVFFAIWWSWVNFTWFASAYDTDDWLYRVVTVVQMGGALTVAAAVSAGIEVQVAAITDPEHVSALAARASVLVPAALFVAAVAAIVLRPHLGRNGAAGCAAAVLLLLMAAALPLPPVAPTAVAAVVFAGLVAVVTRRVLAGAGDRGAALTDA